MLLSQINHTYNNDVISFIVLALVSLVQLHGLVVDKLMRMQIVDAMAILNWLFSAKVTPLFTQQYIWDILEATILKTNRSHLQATKALTETEEKLKKVVW